MKQAPNYEQQNTGQTLMKQTEVTEKLCVRLEAKSLANVMLKVSNAPGSKLPSNQNEQARPWLQSLGLNTGTRVFLSGASRCQV